DREQLEQSLTALACALRPDGIIAFDVCDILWGEARREQSPAVWSGDDWMLVTRTSVPDPRTFRREMTTFVRAAGELWRRDDEVHDNVLVDTTVIPALLAEHGVHAELRTS